MNAFNRSFSQHWPNRTKLSTELACFLRWTPDQFAIGNNPDNLDTVTFFRNLNHSLLTDDTNYDFHWAVFQVIEIALQNESTRHNLIESVRIITGISNFAVKASADLTDEKLTRVWTLVDNITTGISILLEEPHLANIIDYLVRSIKEAVMTEHIKSLQVSTLTNLCFQNKVATNCLLRSTKAKELLNNIKEFPVFFCKMSIAIAQPCSLLEFELMLTLKCAFEVTYFTKLVQSNDQRVLNHIWELLTVVPDEHSRQILQQFDFKETIDGILNFIDSSKGNANGSVLQNSEVINTIFGIVNSILSISNESLQSTIPRLLKLATDSIHTSKISPQAIKTVRLLVSDMNVAEPKDLTSLVTRLIESIRPEPFDLLVISEIYQLLTASHEKYRNIIDELPEDLIRKSIDSDSWCYKLTDANLAFQMFRLQWFLIYTNEREIARQKLSDVMKNKDVHQIFANGLKNSNEEICALTMSLIRSSHFPVEAVSKILSSGFIPNPAVTNQVHCNCQSKVEIRPCFSDDLEKRVNLAADKLMVKLKNENSNVGRSECSKMFEYQYIIANSKESLLQSQLKASSEMVTLQSNEIGGLRLIVSNCQNKIKELEDKLENSISLSNKLKAGSDTLKIKYDSKAMHFKELTKMHDALKQEKKRLVETSKQLKQGIDELKSKREKDRENFMATFEQQKNDYEREKLDLMEQCRKDQESSLAKYEQEKENLKAEHTKDLKYYSEKRNQLENKYKQEKDALVSKFEEELKINGMKIENFEKQLAETNEHIAQYTKEIAEKNSALTEKESELVRTKKQLKEQKALTDTISKLLQQN